MAEQEEMKGGEVAREKAAGEVEAVAIELTAPAGWTKKFVLSEDGTPRRNEIVFISPTGEEIKSKRQLQLYLKAHPGSPRSSEFDWRTGDTPRRSARIREKTKAVETPEDEKPKKRERKSSSKKEAKERDSEGNEASPAKEEGAVTEAKEDVTMQEVAVPADFQTEVGDDANEVIDEVTVDVETKVVDGANKVIDEVTVDVETKVVDGANKVIDEVTVDVETEVVDGANKVIDEVTVDVETKIVDGANKVIDETVDVEPKVVDGANKVIDEVTVDVEPKVVDGANKVIDEVTVDVEPKVVDGANKVIDEVPADVETKVDGDANKFKDEVCADVETQVAGDANKAIVEVVVPEESPNEKKDSVLESNPSAKNETEAFSENQKEATPEVVPTPVAEKDDGVFSTGNSQHKEDAEAADLSEPPSTSCGESQHLPKASPVNC